MQLNNFASSLLVMAAAIVPNASAGCYSNNGFGTGLSMPPGGMKYHATRACKGYDGIKGKFQGTFNGQQRVKVCVNNGVGKINMEVGNLQNNARDIKDADCEKELHKVIDDCKSLGGMSFGGRFDRGGWTFRVDPNDGKC